MAEDIGNIYKTKIPSYAESADIQAALKLFHYGSTTVPTTEEDILADSLAGHLKDLQGQVDVLDARGIGSDYLTLAQIGAIATPEDGFIAMASDSTGGAVTTTYAAALYQNEPPTENLIDGMIWVDKDSDPMKAYVYDSSLLPASPWIVINQFENVVDALGDLVYASGDNALTRLPIGSNGQVLKVNAGVPSWQTDNVYSLPSQSGNSGKFLTTDGTNESWGTVTSGAVVQVKQFTYNTEVTTSSTSYISTGLTGSITPTSSSNKILVMATLPTIVYKTGNDAGADLVLYRGSTQIYPHTNTGGYRLYISGAGGYIQSIGNVPLNYIDSPSSTDPQTYTVYFREMAGGGGAVKTQRGGEMSTLILMEVTP